MICGAADEGRLLYLYVGGRSQILELEDGRRGWICPEGRSA